MKSLNNKIEAHPGPGVADDPGAAGAFASLDGLGADGSFLSLSIGADYQFNRLFVVGAFFDYDFNNLDTELKIHIPGIPLYANGKVVLDDSWSLGARLGYLASASTMLFISAGYTSVGVTDLSTNVSGPIPDLAASGKISSVGGVFIGGGFETKLTDHISLRGEYRYTDFGGGDVTLPTIDGTNLNEFVSAEVEPTLHVTRLSLAYRF